MTLEEILYQIDQGLKKRQLPEMDTSTLGEVAVRVNHPEVMKALESGQTSVDQIVDEAVSAMRHSGQLPPDHAIMQQAAEGGLVNDQSGQATNRIRQDIGLPQQDDGLLGGP